MEVLIVIQTPGFMGAVRFLRGHTEWGVMERKGFEAT